MHSWFFPRRLGRLAWLGRIILLFVPTIAIIVLTGTSGSLRPYLGDMLGEIIGWAAVLLAILYAVFFIHLPRCRSLGLPGGALVVLLLPPVNILLGMLFIFGSEGYWLRLRRQQQSSPQYPK